jgi:hypothetical protein
LWLNERQECLWGYRTTYFGVGRRAATTVFALFLDIGVLTISTVHLSGSGTYVRAIEGLVTAFKLVTGLSMSIRTT